MTDDSNPTDDGVVILVGSGQRAYREYLLAGAARRRPIWILDAAEPTWQQEYVLGSTTVELLDRARLVPDTEGLIKAAEAVAAEHRVVGVFSYDETLVVTTALIAERLGLPGLTSRGADNCRNKHNTRQLLTAAGLPQPRFAYVTDAGTALATADSFGYPVVLKPRGMGASIGVIRVDGPEGIREAFEVADAAGRGGNSDYEGGVLVEECVMGPEISIDGAVFDGAWTPLFLAHKEVGLAPYFEETGHVVSATDPLLADEELLGVLRDAHRELGIGYGITHTEVKLTGRGPVIIEVNARLGGDLIPYLGSLATGVQPGEIAADLAAGVRPEWTPAESRTVGIRFLYPPENGTVRSVDVPAPADVPGLLETNVMVAPGATLLLPPEGYLSRYANLICAGESFPSCEESLAKAAALTTIVLAG
ncbi:MULTISPECIES: ATP-grasp domain-containing protein [Streptomyces]|uniref:ATP-grasp domain-containing protein n=1 Tax=Streptomyces TaxID=1883 RepID=UPI00207AC3FD|nr:MULTISPECIES: ATP-grasp domain-containing protein [Streptomyces]MCM9080649.1 ATP-grasp domain-containing protein [Streptomyces spororaveus]MCX5304922.1 ATP-grasp domain-containing protein [Streptomyces sp. NBC_00160]